MIVRSWHGRPKAERAADYLAFLDEVVFPEIRGLRGNRSARALRATDGTGTVLVLTEWDDMDAVKAFAGVDPTVAVVPEFAQELLEEYDARVSHFEVVLDSS